MAKMGDFFGFFKRAITPRNLSHKKLMEYQGSGEKPPEKSAAARLLNIVNIEKTHFIKEGRL